MGGSLRDHILNRPSNDYDFAVPGNARVFAEKVAKRLGVRTIEMGKKDKALFRVVSGDRILDFSPIQGGTIEDDLIRRDFTANALAFNLSPENPSGRKPERVGGIIDPVGGLDDIRLKTIRLVSEHAILADPLRILRAFRLAAVLGFDIAPQTLSVIKRRATLVTGSARERIRTEVLRMLEAERSFSYIDQMSRTGVLMKLFPELEPCRDCLLDDPERDVFQHVMRTYEEIEVIINDYPVLWPEYEEPIRRYLGQGNRKALLKLAALLHDLGKPATRRVDFHLGRKRLRFLTHEETGAQIVKGICLRLRMSADEGSYTELIVRNHLRPLLLFDARQRGTLTTRGIVRFVRKYEDDVVGLLLLSLADQRAKTTHSFPAQQCRSFAGRTRGREAMGQFEEAFRAFLREILQRYFSDFRPMMTGSRLITGKDLIEHFDLTPSRLFGNLLHKVEEARLNREIQTKEEAFELVDRLLHGPGSRTGSAAGSQKPAVSEGSREPI